MPELVDDLVHLPLGSHCLSFHVTNEEEADQALSFLAGTPPDQEARYFVADEPRREYYEHRLETELPDHVGCVSVLGRSQVEEQEGKLRPVGQVLEFVGAHPEGVTAAGETLTRFWTRETIPDHLDYEEWFEEQRRDWSRFMCPYDLRAVPPSMAPDVIRQLGLHHSHVVLSASTEPAVRLLQLFVFHTADRVPHQLRETLDWALQSSLIEPFSELTLTEAGDQMVREWSRTAVIDW